MTRGSSENVGFIAASVGGAVVPGKQMVSWEGDWRRALRGRKMTF